MNRAKMGLGDLLPVGITLVVVGIALAFGLQVIGDVDDDFTAGSAEANASTDAVEGVGNLASKLPTIGLIAGVVVIIALLVRNFAFK